MDRLEALDKEKIIAAIQDEISCSPKARYYHRLHVALYALKTGSCYKAASVYGHSHQSVYNWLHRLNEMGLAGLQKSARQGRSLKLSAMQTIRVHMDLAYSPKDLEYDQDVWTGKLLSHHLKNKYHVSLLTRQCQNILSKKKSALPKL